MCALHVRTEDVLLNALTSFAVCMGKPLSSMSCLTAFMSCLTAVEQHVLFNVLLNGFRFVVCTEMPREHKQAQSSTSPRSR